MVLSLKELFVPALRQRGFKGSLPHFRRPLKDRIDLLTVQFDLFTVIEGRSRRAKFIQLGPEGVNLRLNV
jgi:Domain of unknown function (DUF4304)